MLAALLCFVLAAVGYDSLRGTGSHAAPWLLWAGVLFCACTLLLLIRWMAHRAPRRRRR